MAKAIAFMLLTYLMMALGVGILAGGGGYAATSLTADIDDNNPTLPVVSTAGFLDGTDYVEIGSEKILYTGTTIAPDTFTGCTRGHQDTVAVAHPDGATVYTTSASVVNSALGFNIAATVDSMGLWSIITVPFMFLFKTMPQLLIMPYQLFTGELMIIAAVLVLIQVAIVITIGMSFIGARRV